MAKVLIAGCGDIGTRLAKLLLEKGHNVVGLRRKIRVNDPPEFTPFVAEISSEKDLRTLARDFDQVFFMIAPDQRNDACYRAVYQVGLSHLIAHFSKRARPPHWIFISSTRVYGETDGAWVDEMTPVRPKGITGQYLYQAENQVMEMHSDNIIVRFSGIYGPNRRRLLRLLQERAPIQSDPPYYTNRIHQEDCAGLLSFLFEARLAGKRLDSCYLGSDDAPVPMFEIMSWLGHQMKLGDVVQKPKEGQEKQNKRCRNDRLKALGYQLKYPCYQEGYRAMVLEAQQKQEITRVFNEVAAQYDGNLFFSISAQFLIEQFSVDQPNRLLDVACGTGSVALLAAEKYPQCYIDAMDLSRGMLAQAKKKAAARNLVQIRFIEKDAEAFDYHAGAYDVITCAYGLFFFPQMSTTLNKIIKSLKPGGRFIFSSFSKEAFMPFIDLFIKGMKQYGIEMPESFLSNLKTPEEIKVFCAEQGLIEGVEIQTREIRYEITLEDWWSLLNSAGCRGLLMQLNDKNLEAFKTVHFTALSNLSKQGKLLLNADSLYGIIHK